jgi:hypothetical protein
MSRGELVQLLLSARIRISDEERSRIKGQVERAGPLPLPFLFFARRILRRGGLHGAAYAYSQEIRQVCLRRIGLVRGVMQGRLSLVPDERLLSGNVSCLPPRSEARDP